MSALIGLAAVTLGLFLAYALERVSRLLDPEREEVCREAE